jgi:NAD(P)-dependent dehydrogenase (short-subunit alcohol dehydrogenase family)
MDRLRDRTALVTGAASGIGRAIAGRFAAEGAMVVLTDVQDKPAEEAVGEITGNGGNAVFVHHDVSQEADWAAAVDRAVSEFGALNVLVNNAGIGDMESIDETSLEDYQRTIDVDQTGVFLGMKMAGDALKASGNGSVINISSIFGVSGGFGVSPAYHAAKGAVRTLTKNVALAWATSGVRVNSIHPGFVETPIIAETKGTPYGQTMIDMTPMGRLGRPEEIAAAALFLASDDASFVTGAELWVDGGYLAR